MLFWWVRVKVEIQTPFLSVPEQLPPPPVYGVTSLLGAVEPAEAFVCEGSTFSFPRR